MISVIVVGSQWRLSRIMVEKSNDENENVLSEVLGARDNRRIAMLQNKQNGNQHLDGFMIL